MEIVGTILLWTLTIYEWVLILRAILSWVQILSPQWTPRGPMLVIAEGVYTLTDPPLRLLRNLIKPLRLGNIHLDMAFLALFLVVLLGLRVVQWVFF